MILLSLKQGERTIFIGLITGVGEIVGGVMVPAVAGLLSDSVDPSAFLWVASALAVLTCIFSFKLSSNN